MCYFTSTMLTISQDREVRALRDQFVTFNYAKILYNGLVSWPAKDLPLCYH